MARAIHRFAVPIILGWLAVVVVLNVAVPPLEAVAEQHSISLVPRDAPSYQATMHIGTVFGQGNSDSSAVIVLEGDRPLDDAAHKYYDGLIRNLRADPEHVQSIQDFWGDSLTAAGAQSADGRAALVQVNLSGNQGELRATESIEAVRKAVADSPAPPGITVGVTGVSAFAADLKHSGDASMLKLTLTTVAVVLLILLLVYRSIVTVVLLLVTVGVELATARGVVALVVHNSTMGLTPFAVSLLTSLAIAAGTDYGIFIVGRYQEARQAGEDSEAAFYTMYRGTAHVITGSGLTIAGAIFCLAFARMPSFQTLGVPCGMGIVVTTVVALTLGPAVLDVGNRFGLFEPKRPIQVGRWRRIGTATVRWPAPILAATLAVALVGLLALPGYRASYDDRAYLPGAIPANQGFEAVARHFSQGQMKPEVLMIESDHDMRNPADFLVLNKLAKAILAVPGIWRVKAITRPSGLPLEHATVPFQISLRNAAMLQTMKQQQDRMKDLLAQADDIAKTVAITQRLYDLLQQLAHTTHRLTVATHDTVAITEELRDNISGFEDFFRPIRSFFYWEKHCFDIPICWSVRSLFDSFDGVDEISDKLADLAADLDRVDMIMPQLNAELPVMISTMQTLRTTMLTMHSTMSGVLAQMNQLGENPTAMGHAFDAARNDDTFYLPPAVFENKDFQRAMNGFLSPDGHAARFIIEHKEDPATAAGIARIEPIRTAAEEALKTTPEAGAGIYLAGTAATLKDTSAGAKWDLLIAGTSSLCLIFIIMLVLTRAFIAASVIVGTVALSLGASFGLSVLFWQYLMSFPLYWLVVVTSVIVLLAVGSDYNLLLVSRFKEEIGAGLNTGIIRSMGGTGKVVTNAGLVFAFTMASMIVSDLRAIGQIGTTIGIGLLFDTLLVRALMTPAIAALLGRWFWWPLNVRTRPASALLRPFGTRSAVRALVGDLTPKPQVNVIEEYL
ncbi:MAG: RND family transporter [Actinomycetota bacterium]|uniref:RND family transporter n=1 Tax=Mycobacterium lentiflavum TaxID=141349 RepID=A0ABY3V495_MYCLN|nr:RND family transporter [Mycobacterium lentiflavum]MEE3066192.1 RND family transporter [Actinomycetota bacterium]ULP44337.1 RND family transporter [Mycobacterium lentiflavum]